MSAPVIVFFNNKGGVGKTSLVYHLANMYANLGLTIVTADLDPQCNLTAAFLDDDRLETLFAPAAPTATIAGLLDPLQRGVGDIADVVLEPIAMRLALLPGDIRLSAFEDSLSEAWPKCLDRNERAFRVTSAFWRIVQAGAEPVRADAVLIDVGPSLGAINRAALVASDFVVIPLGPDLFSVQGLQNLGPTVRRWRDEWQDRLSRNPAKALALPAGRMRPSGYIVLRHSVRLDRPVKAFDRWIERIPGVYRASVLDCPGSTPMSVETDEHCIARLRDYRSLMPLAQEAHKPMFALKPADGALGAHMKAVGDVYRDFKDLALGLATRVGLSIPNPHA